MSFTDYLRLAGQAAAYHDDLAQLEQLIRDEHGRVLRGDAGPDPFTTVDELVRDLAREAALAQQLDLSPQLCEMCADRLDEANAQDQP